eukprot:COSAG02_NODE_4433_length_5362_cov_8.984800_1_plen_68_part_00
MADVCRVLGLSREYVHEFLFPELRHGAGACAAGVLFGQQLAATLCWAFRHAVFCLLVCESVLTRESD